MKAMCLFSYSSSAPSTVQYQSTICGRRLVCNTRCDSFFGDGMISSREGCGDMPNRCIGTPPESTGNRHGGVGSRRRRLLPAALLVLAHLAQAIFGALAFDRVPLAVE